MLDISSGLGYAHGILEFCNLKAPRITRGRRLSHFQGKSKVNTKYPTSSRNVALRVPTVLHDALRHAATINGLTLNGYIKFIAARAVREEAKQVEAA